MKLIISIALLLGAASPAFADDIDSTGANDTAPMNDSATTATKVDQAADNAKRTISDSWITGKVKEQFLADAMVKGRHIHVTTKHHTVFLKGKVESTEEEDRALSIARNTDGVDQVVDHLRVRPSGA